MKKLNVLLILGIILLFAVFSCISPTIPGSLIKELAKDLAKVDEAVKKANEDLKPKIGTGFSHTKQAPFPLIIPAGHPDFTVWPIVEYKNISPEVSMLRLAKPGQGCYRIVVCEWEPTVIALWHSWGAEDFFWIYKDKVPVEVTEEEFKKKLNEAQYLCPERNPKKKGQGV